MLMQLIDRNLSCSDSIKKCRENFANRKSEVLIYGMNRSAKSLIIADCFIRTGKNVIFICNDDKVAEDYAEDLALFTPKDKVSFFPDYEVLAYEERSPHYTIRAQRLEALSRIAQNDYGIFTCSLRSFLRNIAPLQLFKNNIQTIRVGEEYDIPLLVSNLVSNGYTREFQVTKVGEFALRGGIFDFYGPTLLHPVRIEFFGDEIVSIHYFNIKNQRTFGEKLNQVKMIPMREFSLHDINCESDYFWQKIHQDGFYEGIEMDVSNLLGKAGIFADFFSSENCIFFWDEFQFVQSNLQFIVDETQELWEKAKKKTPNRILINPANIFYDTQSLNQILIKYQTYFLSNSYQNDKHIKEQIEIKTHNHHNLHGNLELLEQELSKKIKDNYKVIIQSDNRSQRKRMQDLLPAFEDSIDYTIGVLQNGFSFEDGQLAIYTDHEIFSRYRTHSKGTKFSKQDALANYDDIKPGDYIVHIDHGIGIFEGLKKILVSSKEIECLVLAYANNDKIYVPTFQLSLVSKFVSEEGSKPVIHKLGGKKWEQIKSRAKKQIELVAQDLLDLYAERKLHKGIAFSQDTSWQNEMEESFLYEETEDQLISTQEIKDDMESDSPMERLLCGDVGFGKTEVAMRAAFKAVMSGWQVAVLVPTTLLAEQHYLVFAERIAQYPINIAMFSRFRTPAGLKKDVQKLASGQIDIAIGTHRLLSEDIRFKKLGLLIVDEEHRFGVRHKDKLRKIKSNVDTLYMSATPIPRTLHMALSKLKELSLIQTSPKARLPIRTVVVPYDLEIIKDAILREVDRGGQVYFIHNRVKSIDSVAENLRKILPSIRFQVGHGQLPERQLEKIMIDFAEHAFDVLIATTIIESGIDIPNANTMIINRADTFGLAQLYQMRGRVGRSNRRAYAYLIIPNHLSDIARKRLETLTEYESLGSGYQIAMRDMELRGVGMLLGTKQSGVINSIGYNYYNQLLENAMKNMEQNKDLWKEEKQEEKELFTDLDSFFPDEYIADEKEKLRIYKQLLNIQTIEGFEEIREELIDRFGNLPKEAEQTIGFYKLRYLVQKSALHRFTLKKEIIQLEFDNKNLPSRECIGKVLKKFVYEVKFETVEYFKIIFFIPQKTRQEMIKEGESILLMFID